MQGILLPQTACDRCGVRPVHPTYRIFCFTCGDGFHRTLEDAGAFIKMTGIAATISFMPRLAASFRAPRFQGPQWQGWQYEALGIGAAEPLPHLPYLQLPGRIVSLWEIRLYPPDTPVRLHILRRPVTEPEHRRTIIIRGVGEGQPLTAKDFRRLRQALTIPDDAVASSSRGPKPGSRSIDPADFRRVMPYIDAWDREGCSMPQIKGRLAKMELDDDTFPSVSGRDDDTLRNWLRQWREENLS
jgi:hypothetical protein